MLNITENSINEFINIQEFKAFRLLRKTHIKRLPLLLITLLLIAIFLCLFLPWTQNVNAKGYVTTILPEQRPQAIQAIIPGRLEKWYVREGEFVEQGDTIVFLSEVKSEYFDPNLIERTAEQVEAKSQSIGAYEQKVTALENQYDALQKSLELKREQVQNKILQARNKITMDSIDLVAYEINLQIAENQLARTKELYDKGLKTQTEWQEKELKKQEASAKVTVQQNKLLNQRNELINLFIELPAIDREYADKLAKSQSEQQSALSSKLESMAATSKLQNQLRNYSERQKFYYITAPQSGYITKAIKKGIGETIKEGADVATIMPAKYDLAIEIYLEPQDLPLMKIGNPVQLRFDGWPAIVISGWPTTSTGVFRGRIAVIDQFISDNGYYRILVSPDQEERTWPDLRVGTGARAFILLNNVPIWYEIWRQLNGFPPDFYNKEQKKEAELKRKAPLRSVK